MDVLARPGARERTDATRASSVCEAGHAAGDVSPPDGTRGALVRGMDALVVTVVMVVGASLFGLGTLFAALAGPNKLVVVTVMLMMVAMSSRPADLDL